MTLPTLKTKDEPAEAWTAKLKTHFPTRGYATSITQIILGETMKIRGLIPLAEETGYAPDIGEVRGLIEASREMQVQSQCLLDVLTGNGLEPSTD